MCISLMLAACGATDGDEEPTATAPASDAQPTVATTQDADVTPQESPVDLAGTAVPTNIDMSTLPVVTTPESGEDEAATPETAATEPEGNQSSTPVADAVATPDAGASPVGSVGDETIPAEAGTPEAATDDGTQGDVEVGDGTTGAVIPGQEGAPAVSTPAAPGGSPAASPEAPAGLATPATPLAVSGCEVENVPPFTGDQTTYTLTTDLNFRVGPGAECDLALDVPLGEFQQVVVIGGPVVRTDDNSEWVQIQVGETIGWVAFEFLAPVE